MQNTARKQAHAGPAPDATAPRAPTAPVARGGPVAALQQSIQDRIAGRDLAKVVLAAPPEPLAERIVGELSRVAGLAALALAYLALSIIYLG